MTDPRQRIAEPQPAKGSFPYAMRTVAEVDDQEAATQPVPFLMGLRAVPSEIDRFDAAAAINGESRTEFAQRLINAGFRHLITSGQIKAPEAA